MTRSTFLLLILTITVASCCKNTDSPPAPVDEPELPDSNFFLLADGEVLYDISYSACNWNPSASQTLGIDPVLLLFSPGVFHAYDMVNIPDDLDFYFIFHDVGVQYFGDPTLDEFWSYSQQNTHEFNFPPYKRDFFLKIRKEGKVYQNWWNGNLVNIPLDISRDETGLELNDYEFSRFDEFGDICLHNYSVLNLKGDINGILVTEDYNDTIAVEGNLDLFLNFRE